MSGVHRPLLGKRVREGLFHGVLFPVAGEVEVHRRASRAKGLWARSRLRGRSPHGRGHTRRFPLQGDQPLQGLEDLAIAPPTKSVRPQEPAKRVSPQKSTSPTR